MRLTNAVFLAAVLGALGCGRIREIKGCRALARLVNPVLDDIAAQVKKDPGPKPYRYASKRYEKLAADLKQFDIGIPRAQKSVEDLGTALQEASVQSGRLAGALEQRDVVLAATARRELGQVARLEKAIATRIATDCAAD